MDKDTKNLHFKVFSGVDRTTVGENGNFVEFSPEYDTLLSSSYTATWVDERTVALVGGEGEGATRFWETVTSPGRPTSGLERRERYTDGSHISKLVNGVALTDAAYRDLLKNEGLISLLETSPDTIFTAEATPEALLAGFNKTYGLGDIVRLKNEYGMSSNVRVSELIISVDSSGISTYPTFEDV